MNSAVVVQRVARLPFQGVDGGSSPTPRLHFTTARASEIAPLLSTEHYLGPIGNSKVSFAGWVENELVAAMSFRQPTAKYLPNDGTWWELTRWCLTPEAGKNAGSRMFGWVRRWLLRHRPELTTLVSYSDPSQGHTGTLYRACGWQWVPTWHRLKPPPSGNGSWNGEVQSVKDRWMYPLRDDSRRAEVFRVKP